MSRARVRMAEFVENSRMKMITSANVSMATEGKTAKVKKQNKNKTSAPKKCRRRLNIPIKNQILTCKLD